MVCIKLQSDAASDLHRDQLPLGVHMEFGLFNQMYYPVHRRDERGEHESLMDELAIIEVADRVGFKYAWASEHHFLNEYSHLSASEAFMAYALARTSNIHIG